MKRAAVPSILVAVVLLALGVIAEAQEPKKVHRIGYLSGFDPARESTRSEGIRLALRELGYIEGQNIAIEYRFAEGKRDRVPELAAELVRLKIDIIVAAGGAVVIPVAKNATKTIPIVMIGVGLDPVEAGYVESLARPGGNITGLTILETDLGGKRLELLKEAVPKVTRVAVLYHPVTPGGVRELKEVLPVAARALGLTLQPWEVRSADDIDRVFASMGKQRPDGLSPRLMNYTETARPGTQQGSAHTFEFQMGPALTNALTRSVEAAYANVFVTQSPPQEGDFERIFRFDLQSSNVRIEFVPGFFSTSAKADCIIHVSMEIADGKSFKAIQRLSVSGNGFSNKQTSGGDDAQRQFSLAIEDAIRQLTENTANLLISGVGEPR